MMHKTILVAALVLAQPALATPPAPVPPMPAPATAPPTPPPAPPALTMPATVTAAPNRAAFVALTYTGDAVQPWMDAAGSAVDMVREYDPRPNSYTVIVSGDPGTYQLHAVAAGSLNGAAVFSEVGTTTVILRGAAPRRLRRRLRRRRCRPPRRRPRPPGSGRPP